MKLIEGLSDLAGCRGGFLSIGNFDGVHRGHQQMFARLARHAREAGKPSVVMTFEPHPIQLLRPNETPPSLTSLDQKILLIDSYGVDAMVVYPTDLRLLNLSAREFFQSIVVNTFEATGMVEGPNFFFGRDRGGTVKVLEELCAEADMQLDIVQPVYVGTQMVSSSLIRRLLLEGEIGQATDLLGHRYRVAGRVSRGSGRGQTIGFPTANVTHVVTVLPRDGVYAGLAVTEAGEWPAAINLGPNPTFGEHRRKLEVHLLDFEGDLYDQPLEVEFVARLRDTRPFPDAEALQTQLVRDVDAVRAVVRR